MYDRAIHTIALGRSSAGHTVDDKLRAAAEVGFRGIEMVFEDVQAEAVRMSTNRQAERGELGVDELVNAAESIAKVGKELGLVFRSLQPFEQFEGLKDRQQTRERFEEARTWFRVAHALGSSVIQVPATFLPKDQVDEDLNVHVQDLKKLAQMGAEFDPPIGIMYEALSWSTLVGTWQKAQRVVETVDEPNFWLCHDIFHVGSLLYADYFRDDGVQTSLEGWNDSIRELRTTKNGGKTFVCQLTDSYRLSPPFPRNELWTDGEEHHYLSVSRSSRPLPGEGYLPCREFIDALLASGYTGWFSVETFVPDYEKAGQGVPLDLARRAWSCMEEYLPGQSSSSSSS